jgi:hypothetical protein
MPTGKNARFFPEWANQSGIAFKVHHTDFPFTTQPQILSRNVHNDGEPFLICIVAKHLKVRISGK